MDLHDVLVAVQSHFEPGVVTIVGSGLSVAAGLPSMQDLAGHLTAHVPSRVDHSVGHVWKEVEQQLAAGMGLEAALNATDVPDSLTGVIVELVAELIQEKEEAAVSGLAAGSAHLPFCRLAPVLAYGTSRTVVITTNYDRLLEVAIEHSEYLVDTGYPGHYFSKFEPRDSRINMMVPRPAVLRAQARRVEYKPHFAVLKPHGSIDWFLVGDQPVHSALPLAAPRLMVTPGYTKYRQGYDQPFDAHREEANRAIDGAPSLMTIGYGFNDDQLETHLRPRIAAGTPCLVLARTLTPNAAELVNRSPSILSLSRGEHGGTTGTAVNSRGESYFVPEVALWDLDDLTRRLTDD